MAKPFVAHRSHFAVKFPVLTATLKANFDYRFARARSFSRVSFGRNALPSNKIRVQVSGKRIGIVGLGRIGAAIAKRAAAFDCSIESWGRSEKEGISYNYFGSIIDLAKDSDILVVACPLTEETTRIINRDVLDALGSKGFLVNVARGLIVDEREFVKALVEGRLAGAGLNVFEKEPHVPEELRKLEIVALLPHVAAVTMESVRRLATLCVANLEAHFAGKPVLTPVS